MGDERQSGNAASGLDLREAIDRRLVSDYRVHAMGVTRAEAASRLTLDDGLSSSEADEMLLLSMSVLALKRARKSLAVRRTVVHVRNRKRAQLFAELSNEVGVGCPVFTDDMSVEELQRALAHVRRFGGVKVNINGSRGGFGAQSPDSVMFADPLWSKIDVVEAVGRTLRPADRKNLGHVLLPVLYDPRGMWLYGNGPRGTVEALVQIAANDTALTKYLRSITASDSPSPGEPGSDIVTLDLPDVDVSATEEYTHKLMLRVAKVHEKRHPDWRNRLNQVADYVDENGDFPTPAGHGDRTRLTVLADWLNDQRRAFRLGDARLAPEQVALLDARLDGWRDSSDTRWEKQAVELRDFADTYNRFPLMDGPARGEGQLCSWAVNQRSAFKAGRLSPERKSHLDDLFPGWHVLGTDKDWRNALYDLVVFLERTGEWPQQGLGVNRVERRLRDWLEEQSTHHEANTLRFYRKAALDLEVPGWHEMHTASGMTSAQRVLSARATRIEAEERAELERLLGKYGIPDPGQDRA